MWEQVSEYAVVDSTFFASTNSGQFHLDDP